MGNRTDWKTRGLLFVGLVALFAGLLLPTPLAAHVKWFSDFRFTDPPLALADLFTPTLLILLAGTAAVVGGAVFLEHRLTDVAWYQNVNQWMDGHKENSLRVMRLAMAAILLINWSSSAVLAPGLLTSSVWLDWFEFVLALLLLVRRTTRYAGVGLIVLYFLAMFEFGFFHMLDYLHFVGIGIYLAVDLHPNPRVSGIGLPALYSTIGFALIWLGLEKLVYPTWGLYVLDQNPALALGLPPEFFLQGAALVEIFLGYMLLIGLLGRPLAAVITLVFFATAVVFGKIEVIGHTPLHAALVVFLLNGRGDRYTPPFALHRQISWRTGFAVVNFVVLVGVFAWAYTGSAQQQFAVAQASAPVAIDVSDEAIQPEVTELVVVEEPDGTYALQVGVDGWKFQPEPGADTELAGYADVFVNGARVGRAYSEWFHLGDLEPGETQIVVALRAADGREYLVDGEPVLGRALLTAE